MARPTTHGKRPSYYDFGQTTAYASRLDQRFAYCSNPEDYEEEGSKRYALAVIVHGTERGMQYYREAFADFAEAHGCIVLAPLFPVGITAPGERAVRSSAVLSRHHLHRCKLPALDRRRHVR